MILSKWTQVPFFAHKSQNYAYFDGFWGMTFPKFQIKFLKLVADCYLPFSNPLTKTGWNEKEDKTVKTVRK